MQTGRTYIYRMTDLETDRPYGFDRVKELKGSTQLNDDEFEADASFLEQSSKIHRQLTDQDEGADDQQFADSPEDEVLLDQEFPPEGMLTDELMAEDTPQKSVSAVSMEVDEQQQQRTQGMAEHPGPNISPKNFRASTRIKSQKQALLKRINNKLGLVGDKEDVSAKEELASADSVLPSTPSTPAAPVRSTDRIATPLVPRVMNTMETPLRSVLDPSHSQRDELIKLHRQHIRDNTDFGKIESKILVNLTMKMGKQVLSTPGSNNASLERQINEAFDGYVGELQDILQKKQEAIQRMLDMIQALPPAESK